MSDIPVSRVQEIIGNLRMNERVLQFIREHQDVCYVVTGNLDAWIEPLKVQFGCRFYSSSANIDGDRLMGVAEVLNKGHAVNEIRTHHTKISAIGDGMGDVAMFEQADVCIAFGGAHKPIQTLQQLAHFVTFDERSLCNLLDTLL